MNASVRVLFVCTGNICRSPTAEGVFRDLVEQAGLAERIGVDSAGMISFHAGDPPERSAQRVAADRGVDLSRLAARVLRVSDFDDYEFVVGMDEGHRGELLSICPEPRRERVHLLLDFAPDAVTREVPDPYGCDRAEFERVYDLIDSGARALLETVRESLG